MDAARAIDRIDDSVARRKIATVRRKLGLHHPTAVLEAEVRSNHHCRKDQRAMDGMLRALHGAPESARAALESRGGGLSIEENVDALIDLATDGNVLMRQWQGLELYL